MPFPVNYEPSVQREYVKVPEGTHPAVCHMVVDLGLQETNFGPKNQIWLGWQVPSVRVKSAEGVDRAAALGQSYTLSFNPKAKLVALLGSWRGKPLTETELQRGVDLFSLVGRACFVQVAWVTTASGKVIDKVTGVFALPESVPAPQLEPDSTVIYCKADPATLKNFDDLPKFLQKKIRPEVSADKAAVLAAATAALGSAK